MKVDLIGPDAVLRCARELLLVRVGLREVAQGHDVEVLCSITADTQLGTTLKGRWFDKKRQPGSNAPGNVG